MKKVTTVERIRQTIAGWIRQASKLQSPSCDVSIIINDIIARMKKLFWHRLKSPNEYLILEQVIFDRQEVRTLAREMKTTCLEIRKVLYRIEKMLLPDILREAAM